MGAPQYEQAGADIGGTGTTNTIPRWTGASTLGDSIIIQGSTANAIGIGTTPNAWNSAIRAFDLRTNSLWNFNSGSDSVAYWTVNAYTDAAGNVVYKNSAAASQYTQNAGAHVWARAASGAAGAGCSFLESARIDSSGNFILNTATTGATIQAAGSQQGLKLPATPGNADTQTLDCYAETTLNSGFTTSGITSTGTFTVTARATRIGRSIAITVRIVPSGGASLTFASGWYITLTGMPQMPSEGPLAATTADTVVGRASVQISGDATPILYGGSTGAYALGANIPLNVSGIIT